jgi:uncharacterized protein
MSYSIDANILLFSSDTSSALHDRARDFMHKCSEGPELLCLAWPTIMAYLRISTHPRIFRTPLAPADAMQNVEALLSLSQVRPIGELDGFLDDFKIATQGVTVRGNLVPDAQIAALLLQHGVRTFYSNDRDFHRFSFLDVRDPLV